MSKHFIDPKGDLIAVALIQRVHHAEGKGVMAFDMRQRPVLWIEEKDNEKATAIREKLIELVQSKGRTGQPDWSVLEKKRNTAKAPV